MFVLGFVGFSSKPSPIYGGLGLIVSGGVGCGLILSFGGSFFRADGIFSLFGWDDSGVWLYYWIGIAR
jgi:NADH-ubiquinone oxidoreductase chain 6